MATNTAHLSNSHQQATLLPAEKTVVIVGGGMSGLGAARDLARQPGVNVIVLEARNRLGGRLDTRHGFVQTTAGLVNGPTVPPTTVATQTTLKSSPETTTTTTTTTATVAPLEARATATNGATITATKATATTAAATAPDLALGTDIPIDLGASWLHGADETNPLMALVKSTQSRIVPTNTDAVYLAPGEGAVDSAEGDHYWAVVWDIFEEALEYTKEHRDTIPEDMSLKQWLDAYFASRQTSDPNADNYMSEQDLEYVPLFTLYWADENAIPLDRVAMKYLDAEEMYPGDHCIMADGYDILLRAIVKDMPKVKIHLEQVVRRIEYAADRATVWTNRGAFPADAVLVTLPLGVLKEQSVTFVPPLPQRKQEAITRLGFGTMFKIVLVFKHCFWPDDKHFINFLPTSKTHLDPKLTSHLNPQQRHVLETYMAEMPNYTSLMPVHRTPILIGYSTNGVAEMLEKLSDKEIEQVFVAHLAHYYPCITTHPDEHHPVRSMVTRWRSDPFACGSYTSIPVGSSPADLAQFEIPIRAVLRSVVSKQEHKAVNGTVHGYTTTNGYTRNALVNSSVPLEHSQNGHVNHGHSTHNGYSNSHGSVPSAMNGIYFTNGVKTNGHVAPALHYHRPCTSEQNSGSNELKHVEANGVKAQRKPSIRTGSLIGVDVSNVEDGVVFFAGEHTTAAHFASLHGAYYSGQREAVKVLKRLVGRLGA